MASPRKYDNTQILSAEAVRTVVVFGKGDEHVLMDGDLAIEVEIPLLVGFDDRPSMATQRGSPSLSESDP
ncbi:hypothetical protein GCM10010293_61460 [Streptomyces griseoflavus]|nr:hypothetical protein GCM10010293_61460 [Streptomyces griseoflavus]